ncbi:MAG: aminoacyl-tRNA hydrolase [Ruminococcus sp.]|jgi:PTH1 family peptidyl-tRNA hydrolase|nr:aminoacyl-tRNA hydrolase [Ruminococcus sp.]
MDIFKIFEGLHKSENAPAGKISWIIAGLGNPGLQYENTRHNAGFMAIELLAEKHGVDFNKLKFKSQICDITVGQTRVLLLKPTTYMNRSGEAICDAMNFYKIKPEHTLILCDEIYADPGNIRIRQKGSHGGHNGLKSIFELTGSENFPRIKIGIGKKPPGYDLADWVLSKFTPPETDSLKPALENAAAAAELIADGKIAQAMNQYSK